MKITKKLSVVLMCFSLLFVFIGAGESFAVCPSPAQILGDTYSPTTVQDAHDYASSTLGLTDFTLRIAGEIITEDIFLDAGTVTLDGGYDCTFTTKVVDISGIFGTVFVSTGTLIAEDVRILSSDRCDIDRDLDGYTDIGSCSGTANDCNDLDATVFPGAPELCDLIDNNCNGQVDEDPQPFDADGDGFYGSACGLVGEDCNDANASIYPGALDVAYDGIDQDCDGVDLTYPEGEFGGECNFCHSNPESTYANLHAPTSATDGTCAGCHAPFVSNILPAHYGRTVLTDGNNMTAGQVIGCKSCHDQIDNLHNFGLNQIWPRAKAAQPNVTCDTCHTNRATLHQTDTAHDNRIIVAECGGCHTSDTTTIGPSSSGTLVSNADVDALHNSDCSLCHNYSGTRVNTTTVRQVITQGIGGTPVSCTDCHTDQATGHVDFVHPISVGPNDLSYDPPGILCSNCHVVSTWAEIEGVEHNVATNGTGSCATCHNSTRPDVIATITRGLSPTRCLDCHADKYLVQHGMVNHEDLGYTTGVASYCVNCHDGVNVVSVTHKFDCFLCHTSVPALKLGLPPGGGACLDCHTTTWESLHATNPPSHNALVQVGLATCGDCHSDPPPLIDAVDPKVHNTCSSCHNATGGLISLALDKDFATGGDCTTCHTGTWEAIHPTAPQSHSVCTSCHNPATGGLLILGQ